MKIAELMSSPVVSLLAEQTMPLAREIMRFRHVWHVPVVDEQQRVVGLISHRDLLRWLDVAAELRREHRDDLRVEDVMTRDVWTVGPDTPAADVGRAMLERKLGCAPIVDDRGGLLGIVTESDFVRVAVEAIEGTESARRTDYAARNGRTQMLRG